jgi:N-acetylmuramoyl-L-alanine amidase
MSDARHSQPRFWAAAWAFAALCLPVHAAVPESSLSLYRKAEQLQQLLEQMPESQRTRVDYERVLDAYRAVYHGDPGSAKADASIDAVAGLLADDGRLFHSQKALRDAVGQYEFLRQQYPYSSYRFAALIAEGEIYYVDLADRDDAKEEFETFLRDYPRHPLVEQARERLAAIRREEALNGPAEKHSATTVAAAKEAAPRTAASSFTEDGSARSDTARRSVPVEQPKPETGAPVAEASARSTRSSRTSPTVVVDADDDSTEPVSLSDSEQSHGGLTRVTDIRYWSNPSGTRIAIALEDQVKFGAARIPSPNRIYFDLRGTRLGPGLNGKSIAIGDDPMLTRIRAAQFSDDMSRIVLDVGTGADYTTFFLPNPWRLIIDIHKTGASTPSPQMLDRASRPSPAAPSAVPPPARTMAISDASSGLPASHSSSPAMTRRVSSHTLRHSANELDDGLAAAPPEKANAAISDSSFASDTSSDSSYLPDPQEFPAAREPGSGAEHSLARTLGLKVGRIVIDAGHGGHDCGTLGPGGIEEKDITLDVALRLGRLLKSRLGADIVYTRHDDTFIPLQTRTQIANAAHADLFISVHANSSPDPAARGVESYYLNFTSAPDALEVAARENADSGESISNLTDLVKQITLKDKIEESRQFAADVQQALYTGLEAGNPGLKDRGVKKAPFVVLIGANMPSILAEISFLTNPDDARELRQAAYRERIAESLYRGVARYISGLNGLRLAENSTAPGN